MASPPNDTPRLVDWIRSLCASELGESIDFPFFHLDRRAGEHIDAMLLRRFREERSTCRTDREAVLVLCHG